MKTVPKDRIDFIINMYSPECRWLTAAFNEYPKAQGIFNIKKSFYLVEPLKHMTAIEAQLCINQLAYVSIGEWMYEGQFTEAITKDTYKYLTNENMLIYNSELTFKSQISINSEVNCSIELTDIRKLKGKNYGTLNCIFNNGEFIGTIKFVLIEE